MIVPVINPLRDKECRDVDMVLNSEPGIRSTLEACKRCGMDMSVEEQQLDAQKEYATAVKREFNPLAT